MLASKGGCRQRSKGNARFEPDIAHQTMRRRAPASVLYVALSIVLRVTLLKLEELRIVWRTRTRVAVYIAAFFRLKHPEHISIVGAGAPRAWSVSWARRSSIGLMSRPFALFLVHHPGCEAAFVVPNWETAAFHAGFNCRQGHRVIGIWNSMSGSRSVGGRAGLQRALAKLRGKAGTSGWCSRTTLFAFRGALAGISFGMRERQRHSFDPRASGVDHLSWLASRGIECSGSLIGSLADDSWFTEFQRRSLTTLGCHSDGPSNCRAGNGTGRQQPVTEDRSHSDGVHVRRNDWPDTRP